MPPSAEAKDGAKLHGWANSQARQQGGGSGPTLSLGALPSTSAPAGSLLQPAPRPPVKSARRAFWARVVDVEVESLVAQQGVGVVELQEVDALTRVVGRSLHARWLSRHTA